MEAKKWYAEDMAGKMAVKEDIEVAVAVGTELISADILL